MVYIIKMNLVQFSSSSTFEFIHGIWSTKNFGEKLWYLSWQNSEKEK